MSVNPEFVIDPKLLVQVMLGGNALLTFESKKSKDHRVFHIVKKEVSSTKAGDFTKKPIYYIRRNGIYLGKIDNLMLHFGTEVLNKDQEILNWIWKYILDPAYIDKQMNIYHNGKCCVCGRRLTDSESIKLGIGPTCRTYIEI